MNASSWSACARIARTAATASDSCRPRTSSLHVGLDQLAETNTRGRFSTQLPKRGPGCVVDRNASNASAHVPRPRRPPAWRRRCRLNGREARRRVVARQRDVGDRPSASELRRSRFDRPLRPRSNCSAAVYARRCNCVPAPGEDWIARASHSRRRPPMALPRSRDSASRFMRFGPGLDASCLSTLGVLTARRFRISSRAGVAPRL